MITYNKATVGGAYTEGFEATFENGLLTFSKGAICFNYDLNNPELFEYPESFSFNVIGDEEVQVIYNVFLTSISKVIVQRIETYTGEPQEVEKEAGDELLHLLSNFIVPPQSAPFDIQVNHIERVV